MDPVYGFQAVNVEAQQNEASSLLNWMRRMISVRKQHPAFGRGTLTFLYPNNRKILAYVREHERERILCVVNLSRAAQAVELDLSAYRGSVPIELSGNAAFPPVGDLHYMLTLPAYGFFWFLVAQEADAPAWHTPTPDPLPEFITLTAAGGNLARALEGRELNQLQRDVLPEFLGHQRWFRGGASRVKRTTVVPIGAVPGHANQLLYLDVETSEGQARRYFLPVSALWGEENLHFGAPKLSYTLARLRSGPNLGALIDASFDERFHWDLIKGMRANASVAGVGGSLVFESNAEFQALELSDTIRPVGIEERNASFIIGDGVMMKVYRRLRSGEHPEVSIGRFLTEVAGFHNTPGFYGSLQFKPDNGEPVMLAAAFTYIRNQGDAWSVVLEALDRNLEAFALLPRNEAGALVDPPPPFEYPLGLGTILGRRTAELHVAFATPARDRRFAPEPIQTADLKRWTAAAARRLAEACTIVAAAARQGDRQLKADAAILRRARAGLAARLKAAAGLSGAGLKTRVHGDFNLAQVLVVKDDVAFIDFAGEGERAASERHRKVSPLRDIASMLRSIEYAAWTAVGRAEERDGSRPPVRERAIAWHAAIIGDFLAAYWPIAVSAGIVPGDEAVRRHLLDVFLIHKLADEIATEAANRPAWLWLPLHALLNLASGDETHQ
jgi:maltose alpha-D-glucosyltransferase/alpha-amylase